MTTRQAKRLMSPEQEAQLYVLKKRQLWLNLLVGFISFISAVGGFAVAAYDDYSGVRKGVKTAMEFIPKATAKDQSHDSSIRIINDTLQVRAQKIYSKK